MNITEPDTDIKILEELKRVSEERNKGNWDNHLPLVEVEIPKGIKLPCPKHGRMDVSGQKCIQCEKFAGIVQKSWTDEAHIPWSSKYAILCNHPLERTVTEMVE